jgi:branched-chain amino acid transport system substrate-binding protein
MGRARRFAVCLGVFLLAACGSRVVPLDIQAGGPGVGTGTGAAGTGTAGTGTAGTGTAGTAGTGTGSGTGTATGSGTGALVNCHAPSAPTDKGVTKDTIKLGLIAAKGGSFRGQFDANIEAVDAYFKMINAEEGGICGRKIQLTIRDDGGDAGRDYTAAKELADDVGIFAFVGSISAPDSDTGISRVSKDEKIPDIGFPLTYERSESDYTYGVPGQLQKKLNGEGSSGQRYLIQTLGIKQVAVFWVGESQVSRAAAWSFEAADLLAKSYPNLKICYWRETSVTDLNFDGYASAMGSACPASGGPLAVFTSMENNSNIRLARGIKNQSVKVAAFSPTFSSYLRSFVRDDQGNPRSETEGAYIAMPQIPFERCAESRGKPVPPCSHPELNRYLTALSRYHPGYTPPGAWGGPGWGQADLFTRAAKACGAQLTRVCLLNQIKSINSFNANGFISPTTPRERKIYTADLIMRVHNGEFVELRPNDKSGPSGAPDFWDQSKLFNWWDFFCAHHTWFPNESQIRTFVKC